MADWAHPGESAQRTTGVVYTPLRRFLRKASSSIMAKQQGPPKQWRVRGRSTDGLVVTLGNHATEDEANTDAAKIAKVGFYREVTVERIPHAVEPEETGA